jgi:hypothetical protein
MADNNITDHNKCAHDGCNCSVSGDGPFGKFCSQHCEQAGDITELKCDCGHPGCD